MTHAKHGVVDSGRHSTVLPCCQAWAAEQVRPWTHCPCLTRLLRDDGGLP
jgi:hypothetical protein